MIAFRPTELPGVVVIEEEPIRDERGSFSRTYCRREFAAAGIDLVPVQVSVSRNLARGTLRGLHYQAAPHAEDKLVRCVAGAVFDVVVDLRRDSPAYGTWTALELSAADGNSVFIPKGCAHGFQTLEDGTDLLYLISEFYVPDAQRGVRWDDRTLRVDWPDARLRIISERDRRLPSLDELGSQEPPDGGDSVSRLRKGP
jgi:dTDP-4-dehydrorhamnose 3,5-epimerase